MHILEEKIRAAREAGRTALIPFVTAGFPDEGSFWPAIQELDEGGADIIEIGIPFSDPVADGPVVEEASRRVLSDGMSLARLLSELEVRKDFFRCGMVLMGYYNPIMQYGLEKFATDAARAGVHGVIVPDLPYEEAGELRALLATQGIALIALVGPNTDEERMRLYAEVSLGYVYVVSTMGTTGQRSLLTPQVAATMRRARSVFSLPLALGFGLSEPAQIEDLPPDARPDAAVFGSALLRHLDEGGRAADFIARWK
ncbi:MAG TPA: tryptophan synthase subunit alpha [Candidatus Desulfovibrio gallistercoris]|uniref:tryptophan synthase subunit alpha n=1 Tax=uncultured Desulfovibrio sp. TaxID=167968 RepID=UPI001F8BD516|nr:tryptophan synthase subunit alpha [uncultured Desulfovibrio sp.]HJA76072.1 tryptophan synthase subunit alpha [Candidatus Desulfovibrio gallistercoris]